MDDEDFDDQNKLELRILPVHENLRYLDVVNQYSLARKYASNEIPTKVITYTDETRDSLKSVQEQAFGKLEHFRLTDTYEVKKQYGDENKNLFVVTASMDGFSIPLASALTSLFTSDFRPAVAGGIIMASLFTGTILHDWRNRKKEVKTRIRNINENVDKFRTMPIERFEVVKDPEFEDIYRAIKNNEPLKIKKPVNNDYQITIERMTADLENTISPFPKVFEQKLATY